VLAALLPDAVSTFEIREDPPGAELYPEEEACVVRAVAGRRREFATGRYCARVALRGLGLAPTAIAKGRRGAPDWPQGVIGSITHCAGYRAAAVARASDLVGISIDAEPNEPLPADVLDLVGRPPERHRLAGLAAAAPGVAWDRLLFSAKESVYKAWAPLTGTFLDFDGADITFDPEMGTFRARILAGGALPEMPGRFVVGGGLALTAVAW
jgi:4'-phosphopantetheinyl transferase EntD